MTDIEAQKRSVFDELDAGVGPIHAVVSPAKTATTTVAAALVRAGVHPVVRTHMLRPDLLSERASRYAHDPHHLRFIWEAEWLAANPPSVTRPWSLVTVVRDPIGRLVSAYLQELSAFDRVPDEQTVDELLEALTGRVGQTVGQVHRSGRDWFDDNLRDIAAIDVYDHPFDPSVGYTHITTDRVNVLVLRMENLDVASRALGSALGIELPDRLTSENVSRDKDYAALYKTLLDRFRPWPRHVSKIYAQRLARHFYSDEERAGFERHWTRPVLDAPAP